MNTTAKEKPMVVNINRYFRPRMAPLVQISHGTIPGPIISDRGVTVMVTLDYNTRMFTAKWSICNGDNFNKSIGIAYAQACANPIIGPLPPAPGVKLIEMMLEQIDKDLVMDTLKDEKVKRNLLLLKNELKEVNEYK